MSIPKISLGIVLILFFASMAGCSTGVSGPTSPDSGAEVSDVPRDLECINPDIVVEVTPVETVININREDGGMVEYHIMVQNNEQWSILPAKGWVVGIAPWGDKYWPDTPYIPDPIQLWFSANQEFHYDWAFEVPPGLPCGLYTVQINIGFYMCPSFNKSYASDTFVVNIHS